LAYGTSILRGEDSQSKGNYYVAEVIEVVPEPGRPEASRRMKEVAKEGVRGAITALCEVSGCLLTTQGQKIIIRNIQEDNSVIPVAFLDVQVYVSDVKSAKNLILIADRLQGTWLAGFGNEPFRMSIISKELRNLEVDAGDFVLYDGALYPVIVDAQQNLHLLQYDPEDSLSAGGQKLLSRAKFFLGRNVSSIISVPMSEDSPETLQPIIACRDGVIATIIPVTEQAYRSLFVLHQQVLEKEEHTACLNPRMHRVTGQQFHQQTAGRGLLDYALIGRFQALSVAKRRQYSRKIGKAGESVVWREISSIEHTLDFI
jgi:cleavage and polyadenylation specificity factor subunit 1